MKRLLITAVISLLFGVILGIFAGRSLPPSRDQVTRYLSNLSVGEFSEFFKRMTAQWGAIPGMPSLPGEPSK